MNISFDCPKCGADVELEDVAVYEDSDYLCLDKDTVVCTKCGAKCYVMPMLVIEVTTCDGEDNE